MSDELGPEVLALVGEIALEASKLDLAVAELVATYEGSGGEEVKAALAKPGGAFEGLQRLVKNRQTVELRRLRDDVQSVRRRRDVLMHSIVMHEYDEAGTSRLWWWHPRSDCEAHVTRAALEEHLFDVQRCFGRVVRMVGEVRADRARYVPDRAGNSGESRGAAGSEPA